MTKTTILCVAALLFGAGCGGDQSDTDPKTTPTAETGETTPKVTGENEWAQLCGDGLAKCPADHHCFMAPVPAGSSTQGYCSPDCSVDTDCTDGFVGPGTALCFSPPDCLIDCLQAYGDDQCPKGLTCLPTGGPTNACGVPAK